MKNICFIIDNLAHCGGTERVGTLIANELSKKGYGVYFVNYCASGIPFFSLESSIKVFNLLSGYWEKKTRNRWRKYASLKLKWYLRKYQIDVVIDIDTLFAVWTYSAIKDTSIKWISWDHFNYDFSTATPIRKKALELVRKYADALVLLTQDDLQMYRAKSGIDPRKLKQIYNPISFQMPSHIDHPAHKVMAMGRIGFQKGFDLLLKSWLKVEKQNSDWTLEIVCGQGDYQALQQEAEAMGLKSVQCVGASNDVQAKMKEAGIFALSSRFEGFPLAILEAAAMSLPIVAYNCPTGPKEILINQQNGLLVENGDIDAFADALLDIMNDDEQRSRLSISAYETSQRFQIDKIIPIWIDLIENI